MWYVMRATASFTTRVIFLGRTTVIAVAVSGQSGGAMNVSTFLHNKADPVTRGEALPKELRAKPGASIRCILIMARLHRERDSSTPPSSAPDLPN